MSWYLCNANGNFVHVLGKADYDNLFELHPYKWSVAIEEDNMSRILKEKKKRVVFYQEDFDFD